MNLEQRIETLENRIALLERKAGVAPKPENAPPPKPLAPPAPAAEKSSGQLLGIIGVICFVFAAVYIVKLAIDSGWLTPARQIACAGALGLTLIGCGFLFKDRDREYFSYLPAAGIVILFLTVFGATNYYHLIPAQVAAIASVIISAICLFLYQEFKFGIYQVIASVGAYVMPFFMAGDSNLLFTNINFVIVSVTFTVMAIGMDLRPVSLLSAYLAIAVSSLIGNDTDLAGKAAFVALHFVIFAAGAVIHSVKHKKPLTKAEAMGFFPLILFFYGIEYSLFDRLYPNWAPLFSLLVSFSLLGLYFTGKKSFKAEKFLASGNMIFTAVLIMLVHSIYFVTLPEDFRPLVFLLMAAGFFTFRNRVPAEWNLFHFSLKLLTFALFAWNYLFIVMSQFKPDNKFLIANGFIYTAALIGVSLFATAKNEKTLRADYLLILAHAISIVSFYNLVKDGGSIYVSIAWAVYAMAILGYGYIRKDGLFTKSSLVVLLISAGKVLLYDTSDSSMGVRVICLLVTGALLYFSGFIFRRADGWKTAG